MEIIDKVNKLYNMWKVGLLGGEKMPEDSNPRLPKGDALNYLYFTLPMALNYQRNSYKLWESALKTFQDTETKFVFNIDRVILSSDEELKQALTKYGVALQPNKQPAIWRTLCVTIKELFNGDIRRLLEMCNRDVDKIREYIQVTHKREFPYLSGNKICNYWLYVLYQYTDMRYVNIGQLTVAPDTHVVQATKKLGLISDSEYTRSDVQSIVVRRWEKLLQGTELHPIDMHTPLWLWSRGGFKEIE